MDHHQAKLTNLQVREIRRVYHAWKEAGDRRGYQALAGIFGISMWTARDLVTYRTRKSA